MKDMTEEHHQARARWVNNILCHSWFTPLNIPPSDGIYLPLKSVKGYIIAPSTGKVAPIEEEFTESRWIW